LQIIFFFFKGDNLIVEANKLPWQIQQLKQKKRRGKNAA
jgi:hypothetical protein